MGKLSILVSLLMGTICLFGCALVSSKLSVNSHYAYSAQAVVSADAPTAYIGHVKDVRIFSDGTGNPADPTPVIASEAERNITIGRKRDGFGQAMAAVTLSSGETVTSLIRSVLE